MLRQRLRKALSLHLLRGVSSVTECISTTRDNCIMMLSSATIRPGHCASIEIRDSSCSLTAYLEATQGLTSSFPQERLPDLGMRCLTITRATRDSFIGPLLTLGGFLNINRSRRFAAFASTHLSTITIRSQYQGNSDNRDLDVSEVDISSSDVLDLLMAVVLYRLLGLDAQDRLVVEDLSSQHL